MTEPNEHASRALNALSRGIAAVPGDADHPAYEDLEGLVDGRLDDVEREVVESHVANCAQCAEDLADLRGVAADLQPTAPAKPTRWWLPAASAAAAAVLIAVWAAQQPASPAPQAGVAQAPVQSAIPAAQSVTPDPLSREERALIDRVTAIGRLEIPASISALRGTQGTLLGKSTDTVVNPISPLGTAVLSQRPTFSWKPVKGAQGYSLAIYDDRFREVARSPRTANTTWVATTDLPRDRALTWQVTAHLNGSDVVGPAPPLPEARFKVIDQDTANAVTGLQERLASRPLELGIMLAKSGLLADAVEQLLRAEMDPSTAVTARALRATLR